MLDLLHVLGRLIALELAQADLLDRICAGLLRSAEQLRSAGAFAEAEEKSAASKSKSKSSGRRSGGLRGKLKRPARAGRRDRA